MYSNRAKRKIIEGIEPWTTYEKSVQSIDVPSPYSKFDVVEDIVIFRFFKWTVIICNKIE